MNLRAIQDEALRISGEVNANPESLRDNVGKLADLIVALADQTEQWWATCDRRAAMTHEN